MAEYSVKRKLHNQSGSLLMSVPKIWADAEGLKAGDEVLITFDSKPGLQVFPIKEKRSK
jgi:hypothetical protein